MIRLDSKCALNCIAFFRMRIIRFYFLSYYFLADKIVCSSLSIYHRRPLLIVFCSLCSVAYRRQLHFIGHCSIGFLTVLVGVQVGDK